jgi:hypothetical protein
MMTWEQKFDALLALGESSLRMRAPGNWYVHSRRSLGDGLFERGVCGNGATPQAAVEDDWEIFTKIKPNEYVIVDSSESRTRHRWNGWMWAEVKP